MNDGVFSLTNLDLPKKVKYKQRKDSNKTNHKRKLAVLNNRKYKDYLEFVTKHPKMNIAEMDTVIGTDKSNKVLLTLLIKDTNFMLIRLLDKKCISSVN